MDCEWTESVENETSECNDSACIDTCVHAMNALDLLVTCACAHVTNHVQRNKNTCAQSTNKLSSGKDIIG